MTRAEWNLVAENIRLVWRAVNRLPDPGGPAYDAALDGLILAATKYRPGRCKFSSYATTGINLQLFARLTDLRRKADRERRALEEKARAEKPGGERPSRPSFWELRKLTPYQRRVLRLRYLDELSHREIAARMGTHKSSTEKSEKRALAVLRTVLSTEG